MRVEVTPFCSGQGRYFKTFKEPRNRLQGIASASLWRLTSRYDNPIPAWFLAPIDCSKIPAQYCRGKVYTYSPCSQQNRRESPSSLKEGDEQHAGRTNKRQLVSYLYFLFSGTAGLRIDTIRSWFSRSTPVTLPTCRFALTSTHVPPNVRQLTDHSAILMILIMFKHD